MASWSSGLFSVLLDAQLLVLCVDGVDGHWKGAWGPGISLWMAVLYGVGPAIWDVGGSPLSNWILGKETNW